MSSFQWEDIDPGAGNIVTGIISEINFENLTATVSGVGDEIPIHYHCSDSVYDSGLPLSLSYPDYLDEQGASAFKNGDEVAVIYRRRNNRIPMIIGFPDYPRECIGENQIFFSLARSDGLLLDDDPVLAKVTIWFYNSEQTLLRTSTPEDRTIEYENNYWTINLSDEEIDENGYYIAYTCEEGIRTEYPAEKAPEGAPQFIGTLVQGKDIFEDIIQHWVLLFQPTHPEPWWGGAARYQVFDSNQVRIDLVNSTQVGAATLVMRSSVYPGGNAYDLNGFYITYAQNPFGTIDTHGGKGIWTQYPGYYKTAELWNSSDMVLPSEVTLTGVLHYYWRMAHSKEPNATHYNFIQQINNGYWQDYPPSPEAYIMYGVLPDPLYPQKYAYNRYAGHINPDLGFRYDIFHHPGLSVWSYERWSANVELKIRHIAYIAEGAQYMITVRYNDPPSAHIQPNDRPFGEWAVAPYYSQGLHTVEASEEPVGATYSTTVNPDGQIILTASRTIIPPGLDWEPGEGEALIASTLYIINNTLTTGISMTVDYD